MARKMLSFYVLQFGALLALNFQLYGLIMSYKMFAHRNNMILASFLSSRQSKLQRKRKHALARQLRRKARSVWFQNKLLVAVLARTVLKMRVRKLTSQPGLEKFAIIWEISARLPGPKIPARAKKFSCNRKLTFTKSWLQRWAEFSARLGGLKIQRGLETLL